MKTSVAPVASVALRPGRFYSSAYGRYAAWCSVNGVAARGRVKFLQARRAKGCITGQKKVSGKNDRCVFGLRRIG